MKEYEIIFGMGEEVEAYFAQKGYRNDVSVSINAETYELYFFLSSTIDYEMTHDGFCTFPGLIILEDISTRNIKTAINKLYESGFFEYLRPTKKGEKRYWDKLYPRCR